MLCGIGYRGLHKLVGFASKKMLIIGNLEEDKIACIAWQLFWFIFRVLKSRKMVRCCISILKFWSYHFIKLWSPIRKKPLKMLKNFLHLNTREFLSFL